ncbi:MAG: hypothetical protein HOP07_15260 [Bacteriovoracaceae bacterium]|nr:hypothetical protein [Bacteriovoracaceae bacterium]
MSGFNELSTNGLEGFKDFLIKEIRKSKYKVVVIDGFNIVKNYAIDDLEYSNFFYSLNAVASTLGCTIFLILSSNEINPNNEFISVDGVIELKRIDVGMRDAREIHVHKMRGIPHYEG